MNKLNRGQILSEALPYIKQYHNKTIVIKYGGAAMTDPDLKRKVVSDIALLSMVSIRVVIVHGGGPEINDWLAKMNIAPNFKDGLRVTDSETMDVVQMVLAGKVGKELALLTQDQGGKAISICGLDGGMLKAKPFNEQFGLVGELVSVDTDLLNKLLDDGYIPIISTIASGDDGKTYNINADTAASAIASALKAERLMLLTDVCGLMKDPKNPESLIHETTVDHIPYLIKTGIITGGMTPKLKCCQEAIRRGVNRAHILDGRQPHALLMEMLTDEGVGTMITN